MWTNVAARRTRAAGSSDIEIAALTHHADNPATAIDPSEIRHNRRRIGELFSGATRPWRAAPAIPATLVAAKNTTNHRADIGGPSALREARRSLRSVANAKAAASSPTARSVRATAGSCSRSDTSVDAVPQTAPGGRAGVYAVLDDRDPGDDDLLDPDREGARFVVGRRGSHRDRIEHDDVGDRPIA